MLVYKSLFTHLKNPNFETQVQHYLNSKTGYNINTIQNIVHKTLETQCLREEFEQVIIFPFLITRTLSVPLPFNIYRSELANL